MAKPTKKAIKKQEQLTADEYDVFAEPLIKKKAKVQQQENDPNEQVQQKTDSLDYIKCPIPKLNVQQIFHDILYEASKLAQFLKAVRSILSQGHTELQEKKKYFHYRWVQLQNMNCSRQEYMRHEIELREQQARDTNEVHNSLVQALCDQRIQGFKSKDVMLLEFRQSFMEQRLKSQERPTVEEFQFFVDVQEATQLKKDQIVLLEKLLTEQQLVEPTNGQVSNLFPSREPHYKSAVKQQRQNNDGYNAKKEEQRNDLEREKTAFTICDKIDVSRIINDKLRNINSQKIEEILKVDKSESLIIKKNVRVMLLDSKSDELYTDCEFQQMQTDKYLLMFQDLKSQLPSDYRRVSDQQLNQCLEMTTYLVNNAHYQQKYKQPSSQLQAKEVITLLDKIYKLN